MVNPGGGECHHVDQVASGGNRRDTLAGAELPDHQDIHRAVHRLEYQRAKNRQHELYQFGEYPPLSEVACCAHKNPPFCIIRL